MIMSHMPKKGATIQSNSPFPFSDQDTYSVKLTHVFSKSQSQTETEFSSGPQSYVKNVYVV